MATTVQTLRQYVRDHGYSDDTSRGTRNRDILIQNAFREITQQYQWPFLTKRLSIRTKPPHTAGTLAATHGSATLTGTATGWSSPLEGGLIFVGGNDTFYEVTAVNGATDITIDPVFTDPQGGNVTAASYDIRFPIYSHPSDFRTLKQPEEGSFTWSLDRIDVDEWLALILINEGSSSPTVYAVDGDNTYFYPAPVDQRIVYAQYYYNPSDLTSDTQTPDWPEQYMHVLYRALDKHMAMDRKDANALQLAEREFEIAIKRLRSAVVPSAEPRTKAYEGLGRFSYVPYRVPIREIQT